MPPSPTTALSSTSSILFTASPSDGASGGGGSGGSDTRTIVLATILGLVAFALIAFVVLFTVRLHRRNRTGQGWRGLSSGARLVESQDIASRITPFGTRDGNRPGTNMRVAHRRSNGLWEFSTTPFHPTGSTEADDDVPPPTPLKPSAKERMMKSAYTRDPWDVDSLAIPPPAYSPSVSSAEDTYLRQDRIGP